MDVNTKAKLMVLEDLIKLMKEHEQEGFKSASRKFTEKKPEFDRDFDTEDPDKFEIE